MDSKDYKAKPYRIDVDNKKLKIEGGRKIETKASVGVILKLLGDSIYHSDGSALREQLTNAISHGCMPINEKEPGKAFVDLNINFTDRTIVITDVGGIGIPYDDMDKIVTEMGTSGNHDRARSGQHGLGLFSFLRLSQTAILETWSKVTGEKYAFICEGGATWDEIKNRDLKQSGTRIEITCKEKVDLVEMVKTVKGVCEFQSVRTVLTVEGSPQDNALDVARYEANDSEFWFHGDDVYEFGQVSFEEQCMKNSSVKKVVKLKGKDMDIYVGIGETGHYRNDISQLLLCNVPVSNNIRSMDFPGLWVNLTSEKTYKPPVDRDSMHAETMDIVNDEISNAITDWVKTIDMKTVQDFEVSDDSWLINNPTVDEWLKPHVRELFHSLRSSFKVWGMDETPIKKDSYMTLGQLVKHNTFVVSNWNSNYYEAFRDFYKDDGFVFVKPRANGVTARKQQDHESDVKILNKYFKLAKDVRAKKKIKLTKSPTERNVPTNSVKEVTIRTAESSYSWKTEKIQIGRITKNVLKLSLPWNSFHSTLSIYSNHDEGGWVRNCNLAYLSNKNYTKLTDSACLTESELKQQVLSYKFQAVKKGTGEFFEVSGKDIIDLLVRKSKQLSETVFIRIFKEKDLAKYIKDKYPKSDFILLLNNDEPIDMEYHQYENKRKSQDEINFYRLMTALVVDKAIVSASGVLERCRLFRDINWKNLKTRGASPANVLYIDSTLNLARVKSFFDDIAELPERLGQVPNSMIQQIKSFVKDSGMSEEYSRIFSYISLVMYKQHGVFDAREWLRRGGQPSVVEHNKYEISFDYVTKPFRDFNDYGNWLHNLLKLIFSVRMENPKAVYFGSYATDTSYYTSNPHHDNRKYATVYYEMVGECTCGEPKVVLQDGSVAKEKYNSENKFTAHKDTCNAFRKLECSWDDGKVPITSRHKKNIYYKPVLNTRHETAISRYSDETPYRRTANWTLESSLLEELSNVRRNSNMEYQVYHDYEILIPMNAETSRNSESAINSFNGNWDETKMSDYCLEKVFDDWDYIERIVNLGIHGERFDRIHRDGLMKNFGTPSSSAKTFWSKDDLIEDVIVKDNTFDLVFKKDVSIDDMEKIYSNKTEWERRSDTTNTPKKIKVRDDGRLMIEGLNIK